MKFYFIIMLQVHQFIYDSMCKERGSDIKIEHTMLKLEVFNW